jgi:hypothetical protein
MKTPQQQKQYNRKYYLAHRVESLAKQKEKYRKEHPDWIHDRPNSSPITKEHIVRYVIVDQPTGCWNWQRSKSKSGYGDARERGKGVLIHRRAYELWKGEIPKGLLVCHKCDNRRCCNPDHLFVGTYSDNMQDCVSKGRLNSRTKLSNEQIVSIRSDGRRHKIIAKDYGVSKGYVSEIKQGVKRATAK